MPVNWKNFDVPMSVGLETKSDPFSAPLGATTVDSNTEFTMTGGRSKREGFNTPLGSVLNGRQIVRHGDHLLGFGGNAVYDRSPGLSTMKQVSSFLPATVQSRILKNSSSSIIATDTYAQGNMACTAYIDALGVHARITDLVTGTVLSTQDIFLFTSATPSNTALSVTAVTSTGNAIFFVFFGTGEVNAPLRMRAATQTGASFVWGAIQTLSSGASGLIQNLASAPVPGTANAICFCAATLVSKLVKVNTTGVVAANAALTGVNVAGSPAAIALNQAGSTWWVAWEASGGDLWVSQFLNSTLAAGASSGPVAVGMRPSHVTMVARSGSSNMTVLYDDSAYVGTASARVWSTVLDAALSVVTAASIVWASASLASNAISLGNGNGAGADVFFLVSYRSASTNTISGINFNQTQQNCMTMLVALDAGLIVGRVFRGQALKQINLPSASGTSAAGSNVIFGSLALVASDFTSPQNATTYGAAACVLAQTNVANLTRGFSVLEDFFQPSGVPQVYDGAQMTEAGFNVFPECLCIGAGNAFVKGGGIGYNTNNTGAPSNYQTRANSTTYVVGTQIRGSSTGLAADAHWGHVYVCVRAGKTAATTAGLSWSTSGGNTVDGSCVWQDAGLAVPERKWAAGLTNAQMSVGRIIIPSTPNGYFYVVTVAGAGNTAGAEPVWPTTPLATVNGSGDGYTYMCMTTLANMTGTANGLTYAYAFVYEQVDDQGLLWMSSPSPIMSGITLSSDTPNDNVLFVVSTLRLTNKSNVRIGVYRTTGNGTILKKIMLVPNNTSVDAVAIVDYVSDTLGDTGMALYAGSLGAGELPNVPPPSCSCAATWGQRVVTNSLEDPFALCPSKLINLQSIYDSTPAWSDELLIQMDASFGKVTALHQLDDKLIVFQERRICYLTGDGPDNTGGGISFLEPQPIATDIGCIGPNSVVTTPSGLMFQSPKGIFLLTRNMTTEFIGSPVVGAGLDGNAIVRAAIAHPTKTMILFVTSNESVFVYDYFVGQWSVWTITTDGLGGPFSLAVFGTALVVMDDTNGTVLQQTPGVFADGTGLPYGVRFKLGPIQLAGSLPYVRVRSAEFQIAASQSVGFTVSASFDGNDGVDETHVTPLVGGSATDAFEVRMATQKIRRIAFDVTETTPGSDVVFEAMALMIGVENGNYRLPAAKRST